MGLNQLQRHWNIPCFFFILTSQPRFSKCPFVQQLHNNSVRMALVAQWKHHYKLQLFRESVTAFSALSEAVWQQIFGVKVRLSESVGELETQLVATGGGDSSPLELVKTSQTQLGPYFLVEVYLGDFRAKWLRYGSKRYLTWGHCSNLQANCQNHSTQISSK